MELAVFTRLENKIDKLLGRLETLEGANKELTLQLKAKDGEIAELKQLISSRESEREQVRGRIERLIEKLESLEEAGGEAG